MVFQSAWEQRARNLARALRRDDGQGLVEYALIIALVSLAAIGALGFLSGKIDGLFSTSGNSIDAVSGAVDSGTGGGGGGPSTPTIAPGSGTPVDGGSGSSSTYTSPSFSFASDAGTTFQCSLDNAGFTSCTSPQGYSNLAIGSHTFQVEAVDGSGTSSPASVSWTVTGLAPLTDGLLMTDTGAGDHYGGSGTYYSAGKVETCDSVYYSGGSWHCWNAHVVNTAGVWIGASVNGLGGDACTFTRTGYVSWANKHWSSSDDYYLASDLSVRFTRICS